MDKIRPSIKETLDQLSEEGLVSSEIHDYYRHALSHSKEKSAPWYTRGCAAVFAGFGALILIIGLLMIFLPNSNPLVLGIIFVSVAVIIMRDDPSSDFWRQSAIGMSIGGQLIALSGIGLLTIQQEWSWEFNIRLGVLAVVVMEVILLFFFRDSMHRFLSTYIIIVALLDLFLIEELGLMIVLLLLGLSVATVYLWENEAKLVVMKRVKEFAIPMSYGVTFVFIFQTGFLSGEYFEAIAPNQWLILPVGLMLVLLYQEIGLMSRYGIPMYSPLWLVIVVETVLIGFITAQTPGVMASMIVLILGFQRGNRALYWLGIIFFGLALINFLNDLKVTDLEKPYVIFGIGFLVLGLRWILRNRTKLEEIQE